MVQLPAVARQHPANAKNPASAGLFGSVVSNLVVVLQAHKYSIFAQIARGGAILPAVGLARLLSA
jgi:hypothetical protein